MTHDRALRLLTIDLDDTLWPCAPTIDVAERAFHAWLDQRVPRLAAEHDLASMRRQRRALMETRPDIAHDMTALRQVALEALMVEHGYPRDLAAEAVRVFRDWRNRVEPYAEVVAVLARLRPRYRLVSLTNGNAEVGATPLRDLFHRSIDAVEAGAAKPDPAMFDLAMRWADATPATTLHLGDDPWRDIEAARQRGIAAVWINRDARPWPAELAPPMAEFVDLAAFVAWLGARDHGL